MDYMINDERKNIAVFLLLSTPNENISEVIKFLENYADGNVFRSLCRDVLKADLNIIAKRNIVFGNPLDLDSKHLIDEVKG